jgi:hypothetical protein
VDGGGQSLTVLSFETMFSVLKDYFSNEKINGNNFSSSFTEFND